MKHAVATIETFTGDKGSVTQVTLNIPQGIDPHMINGEVHDFAMTMLDAIAPGFPVAALTEARRTLPNGKVITQLAVNIVP